MRVLALARPDGNQLLHLPQLREGEAVSTQPSITAWAAPEAQSGESERLLPDCVRLTHGQRKRFPDLLVPAIWHRVLRGNQCLSTRQTQLGREGVAFSMQLRDDD